MNELKIVTSVQTGIIEFDDEKFKRDVERQLEEFKGETFDEDTAKKIVATLRAKVKEANAEAIRIDKIYSQPCTEFRTKIKGVTAIIESTITDINKQIEDYEEDRKDKKRALIRETYERLIDGFGEYLPLDKIYDVKWENKTFTLSTIEDEITSLVDSTAQAINTISAMNSEAVPKALESYKSDLSLTNAITYITNYDRQKAEIEANLERKRKEDEELKRKEEEQRIIEETRKKVADEEKARLDAIALEEKTRIETAAYLERVKEEARAEVIEEIKVAEQVVIAPMQVAEVIEDEPILNVLFAVTATSKEIEQIEMYLNSIAVEFSKEA